MTAFSARMSRGWEKLRQTSQALPVRTGAVEVSQIQSSPVRLACYDLALLWATVALLAVGVVVV